MTDEFYNLYKFNNPLVYGVIVECIMSTDMSN